MFSAVTVDHYHDHLTSASCAVSHCKVFPLESVIFNCSNFALCFADGLFAVVKVGSTVNHGLH